MWRRIKQFGPTEVFGVSYRDMTPQQEHFMDEAERAEQRYKQQEIDRQT